LQRPYLAFEDRYQSGPGSRAKSAPEVLAQVSAGSQRADSELAGRTDLSEEKAGINEQVAAVWEATQLLSERQRTVFLLRYVEDLDVREIALSTGLTESTVNVHLIRAVRGIRKRIGDRK
jgi:RNA polymerase sigma-70 factor (ECF subfamily)